MAQNTPSETAPRRGVDVNEAWRRTGMATKAALLIAALGFVISITSTSRVTTDGEVGQCTFIDAGALAAAAVTTVLALIGFFQRPAGRDKPLPMPWRLGTLIVLLLVAGLHVLRGLGVVFGPC